MSELKYQLMLNKDMSWVPCYLKSEADNVIAELEEKLDTTEKLLNKALVCVSNGKNHMMSLARKKNHSDYKRCLAMAMWCAAERDIFNLTPKVTKVEFFARWHKRWLEISTKFKEAK